MHDEVAVQFLDDSLCCGTIVLCVAGLKAEVVTAAYSEGSMVPYSALFSQHVNELSTAVKGTTLVRAHNIHSSVQRLPRSGQLCIILVSRRLFGIVRYNKGTIAAGGSWYCRVTIELPFRSYSHPY
jgi:hypothetical protein